MADYQNIIQIIILHLFSFNFYHRFIAERKIEHSFAPPSLCHPTEISHSPPLFSLSLPLHIGHHKGSTKFGETQLKRPYTHTRKKRRREEEGPYTGFLGRSRARAYSPRESQGALASLNHNGRTMRAYVRASSLETACCCVAASLLLWHDEIGPLGPPCIYIYICMGMRVCMCVCLLLV